MVSLHPVALSVMFFFPNWYILLSLLPFVCTLHIVLLSLFFDGFIFHDMLGNCALILQYNQHFTHLAK